MVSMKNLDDLISLQEAAKKTELSASHIRLLIRQKKIWGKKFGRNWVTTLESVEKYIAQEHKPGRKSKTD